jgi:hypothetical protein
MQAKASRALAAILLATFLISAVGCGTSPLERTVNAMQGCVDAMKSVQDPTSAQAGIEPFKAAMAEMSAASDAFLKTMMDNPAGALGMVSEIAKLGPEIERLTNEMNAEEVRLHRTKGLPVEFWNVYRVEGVRMEAGLFSSGMGDSEDDAVGSALGQMAAMYEQHGPAKVAEFELTNVSSGGKDAALQRIQELAGTSAQVVSIEDPEDYDLALVAVAPVEDFDKLVAAVDFGTVADQDKARMGATIELTIEDALVDDGEAVVDESGAVAVEETIDPAAADVTAGPVDSGGQPLNPDGQIAAEVAPPGYEDRGVPPGYEGRGEVPPGYEGRGEMQPADPGTPAGASPEGALAAARAGFGQLFNSLTGGGAGGAIPATLPDGSPNPAAPDYHAQLAELLFDAQVPHHELAVLALLEVKLSDVTDKKVRARIAQGYKHVALETNAHAVEGVRGLVLWGGKFSAPLLINMLEQQAAGAEEAIFAGLGEIATPEAAEAVVGRMGEATYGGGSEAAVACLRQMGVVAEAALLAELPFESPEANLAAINVLADVGTKKSVGLLRRASKSENEGVAEAALEAARKVQERERKTREPG